MTLKSFTRRDFIGKTTASLAITTILPGILSCDKPSPSKIDNGKYNNSISDFNAEVERLPVEDLYDYRKRLSNSPVHIWRRDMNAIQEDNEMSIPYKGWKLTWSLNSSIIIQNAVNDFQDYLDKSHNIKVETEGKDSLADWEQTSQSIVVGTKEQLPGCGVALKGAKAYEIKVTPECIELYAVMTSEA